MSLIHEILASSGFVRRNRVANPDRSVGNREGKGFFVLFDIYPDLCLLLVSQLPACPRPDPVASRVTHRLSVAKQRPLRPKISAMAVMGVMLFGYLDGFRPKPKVLEPVHLRIAVLVVRFCATLAVLLLLRIVARGGPSESAPAGVTR